MALKRKIYDVLFAGDPADAEPTRIVVTNGDQLRAEEELVKLDPFDTGAYTVARRPLLFSSLMIWAACTRLGMTSTTSKAFVNDHLEEYQPVNDAQGEPEEPAVDPTSVPPGPDSSWPPSSEAARPTGSTPTSTNA